MVEGAAGRSGAAALVEPERLVRAGKTALREARPWWQQHHGGNSRRGKGRGGNGTAKDTAGTGRDTTEAKPRVVLHWWRPVDPLTVPPREWAYGRHYQIGLVSGTVGPGGMGKTSLGMVEGLAMATGRNLLGEQPDCRRRVWFHNGEDTPDELTRRLLAVCQHYGIRQEDLDGWFVLTSGVEMELKVARGYNELKLDSRLIEEITGRIVELEIEVSIFDPLVKLHETGEQSNDRMDTIVSTFASISNACGCGIELSHHTRKLPVGATNDLTVHDARGPTALHAAVRAMRVLNQMSAADAEAFGIGELDRLRYFRVDQGKSNNAAPSAKAAWRTFESVILPNGDDVGVVTEWQAPGQGARTPERAAAERKAEEVFLSLLHKFSRREEAVSHHPGPNYAPARFCDEPAARDAGISKAALRQAMERLLDTGRIQPGRYRHGGRERHRLVPGTPGDT
jgi:RecA-family ATPase